MILPCGQLAMYIKLVINIDMIITEAMSALSMHTHYYILLLDRGVGYKSVNTSLPAWAVWIMHSCGIRSHVQPTVFALLLYVVTALVHYNPYSPGRGVLTIS